MRQNLYAGGIFPAMRAYFIWLSRIHAKNTMIHFICPFSLSQGYGWKVVTRRSETLFDSARHALNYFCTNSFLTEAAVSSSELKEPKFLLIRIIETWIERIFSPSRTKLELTIRTTFTEILVSWMRSCWKIPCFCIGNHGCPKLKKNAWFRDAMGLPICTGAGVARPIWILGYCLFPLGTARSESTYAFLFSYASLEKEFSCFSTGRYAGDSKDRTFAYSASYWAGGSSS
jgi:hypothetical protein